MLIHPALEQLRALRLDGMAKALEEQLQISDVEDLGFEQRLGLLLDREATQRSSRRLKTRLRKAKLRQTAFLEDIDFRKSRGLDKSLLLALASCEWIQRHQNVLICGSTGVGKTFLACALSQKACREDFSALYFRLPRLFEDLALAQADGRYPKSMAQLAKTDVLVLDDLGLVPLGERDRRDLLEILEQRHELRSTIVTSQLPVASWHEAIGDPTLADAILDRLVHNAHRIELKGDSMRRQKARTMMEETSPKPRR